MLKGTNPTPHEKGASRVNETQPGAAEEIVTKKNTGMPTGQPNGLTEMCRPL